MSLFSLLESFFSQFGYFAVLLVLLLCGLGIPIPEDITLVVGGVIAGLGHANVHMMFFVGMIGVLLGDCIVFTLGRFFGPSILKFRLTSRLLTPKRYIKVQEKFEKYGNWVIFVARFLPGLRTPIFLVAGISKKISYTRFLLMDGFAAIISVPIWIYLGSYGAQNIDSLMHTVRQFQTGIFIILAIFLIFIIFKLVKKSTESKN